MLHIGFGLLGHYDGYIYNALREAFPDHRWLPWKFSKIPESAWRDESLQMDFLKQLATKLGVKDYQDWYRLGARALKQEPGGRSLLRHHGGTDNAAMLRLLQTVYPNVDWQQSEFDAANESQQDSILAAASQGIIAALGLRSKLDNVGSFV
jgi:hypothetical protein